MIFDFYGTLTRGRSAAEQTQARAAQAAALGVDAHRFDAELTATVDERFRGAGGDVAGSLAWLCARLGAHPDADTLARAAEVRRATEQAFGALRSDAVDVLRELRARGLRIGLISDCSAELPAYFDELAVAPLVDAPIFSFVTGHRKPEPAIYHACCSALGVDATDCVYVGDGGSNELAGARDVGMRAVHLAVPEETEAVVYGRHTAWDGEVVPSLTAVLNLV